MRALIIATIVLLACCINLISVAAADNDTGHKDDGEDVRSLRTGARSRHLARRADPSTSASMTFPIPLPPSPIPTSPPSPAPTPMDLFVSYTVSSSCLSYITSTIASPTFSTCLPFSLLLTTSTSYAALIKAAISTGNYATLNDLLAYTSNPQPSTDQCSTFLQNSLSDLQSKRDCAKDLTGGKPLAQAFEIGLANYDLMRKASMLRPDDMSAYCYLEAVNAQSPDELYLWSLPAGVSLPSTYAPTCSTCSTLLLELYGQSLPETSNSTNIQSAIEQADTACGGHITGLVAASAKSGSVRRRREMPPSLSGRDPGNGDLIIRTMGIYLGIWMAVLGLWLF